MTSRQIGSSDPSPWRGVASYQVLSYSFAIRWTTDELGALVDEVLGAFKKKQASGASSADLGVYLVEGTRVVYGEEVLARSNHVTFVLNMLLWHINSEAIRRTNDFLLVHAGAMATPDGVGVVLPAPSGAGKTTLVAGLIRAGFDYLSDEAAVIDPAGTLHPYPKALTLKDQAIFRWFPDLAHTSGVEVRRHLRPDEIRPGSTGKPCPIGFVIAFRFVEGAPTELLPLSPEEGARELARNGLNTHQFGPRAFPLIASVVRMARCYSMVFGNGAEAVSTLLMLTSRKDQMLGAQ